MKLLSRFCCLIALGAIGVLIDGAAPFSRGTPPDTNSTHSSNLAARITMLDGHSQMVLLQGVGCRASMCSRVAVRSKAPASARLAALGLHQEVSTWLDSLAGIRDINGAGALFVFKDGSARRLSIVDGNRFFYFANRYLGAEKIDVLKVRSIEFVPEAVTKGAPGVF